MLTSSIPRTQQVHAAREETSLKHTKDDAQAGELTEALYEAHAYHDSAPEDGDSREVKAGADLAD
jgi:hypothetical protein